MYSDDNDNVHSTTPADAEDSNGDRPGSTQSIADIKVNLTEVFNPNVRNDAPRLLKDEQR